MRLNMSITDLNHEFAHFPGNRNSDGIRFGQHIWNKYAAPDAVNFPELFYAEKKIDAYNIAFKELNLDLWS